METVIECPVCRARAWDSIGRRSFFWHEASRLDSFARERWPAGDHKPEDSFYLWGPDVPPEFTINVEAGEG